MIERKEKTKKRDVCYSDDLFKLSHPRAPCRNPKW